jgi:hypothetical protein
MARYDDTFVDRFLEPWNRHDVDGALASKAAIRVAVGEPDFVRWATRFRVAPLRLTNP